MADPTVDLAHVLGLEVDPADLHERLRMVIDPELGINIVDLGLVYGVEVVGGVARVRMTTTTPACPMVRTWPTRSAGRSWAWTACWT